MSVRRSALLAVAALGFATLAACGSSASSSFERHSPGSAASSPAKLKSIFFANPLPAYPDWATADKCFESETAKLGIKGVTQGPTGLQINDQFVLDRISQAIAQNVRRADGRADHPVGVRAALPAGQEPGDGDRDAQHRHGDQDPEPGGGHRLRDPGRQGGGEHRQAPRAAERRDHHQPGRRDR